jgi:hypothetical protein
MKTNAADIEAGAERTTRGSDDLCSADTPDCTETEFTATESQEPVRHTGDVDLLPESATVDAESSSATLFNWYSIGS